MGTLDLSQVEGAAQKVKLLDGELYDMADPAALGALPMQRLVSRYRQAQEFMAKEDADEADIEEMLGLLVDVCEVIVPDAPRKQLGRLDQVRMEKLVQAFFGASPQAAANGAGATSDG